jgi:hypothetical protein
MSAHPNNNNVVAAVVGSGGGSRREEEQELLFYAAKAIVSGVSAHDVDLTFRAGGGDALRRQINDTAPRMDATLLMALGYRRRRKKEDDSDSDSEETIKIANLLKRHGADVNQRDTSSEMGSNPVNVASDVGRPQFLQWLIDQGAHIDNNRNTCNNSSSSSSTTPTKPIWMAAQNDHAECVAILAKEAIREPMEASRSRFNTLDALSKKGSTAAYVAMERGNPECVGALAMAGADLRRCFPVNYVLQNNIISPNNNNNNNNNDDRRPSVDPNPGIFPQASMDQAVFSFVTSQCANCCCQIAIVTSSSEEENNNNNNNTIKKKACGQCRLAQFCSRDCQRENWKVHKKCCKRFRTGQDLVSKTGSMPEPKNASFGFELEFGEKDHEPATTTTGGDEDEDETTTPDDPSSDRPVVWEYNAGDRGTPDWRRYPLRIEEKLEGMVSSVVVSGGGEGGGSFSSSPPNKYMYRPGVPEDDGFYPSEFRSARPGTNQPPAHASTNYVFFAGDMLEREVFTGAMRAVRRNGSRTIK